jgi:hypothetical protein
LINEEMSNVVIAANKIEQINNPLLDKDDAIADESLLNLSMCLHQPMQTISLD